MYPKSRAVAEASIGKAHQRVERVMGESWMVRFPPSVRSKADSSWPCLALTVPLDFRAEVVVLVGKSEGRGFLDSLCQVEEPEGSGHRGLESSMVL